MVSVRTRGVVCGVFNCPSRHWRTINGQKICQYGHVRDGDVEIEEEFEDDFVVTRKLNVPTLSQSQASVMSLEDLKSQELEKTEVLSGESAKLLMLECCQLILCAQVRQLATEFGLPKEFELVVFRLWTVYTSNFISESVGDLDENVDEDDVDDDSFGISFDSDFSDDDSLKKAKSKKASKSKKEHKTQSATLKEASYSDTMPKINKLCGICVCYLACWRLGIPLYSNDFIKFCLTEKIPYLNPSKCIPKSKFKKLPLYYIKILEASYLHARGEFYVHLTMVAQTIFHGSLESKFPLSLNDSFLTNTSISPKILIGRLVHDICLPSKIYDSTLNVLESQTQQSFDLSFINSLKISRHFDIKVTDYLQFTEVKIASLIITMAKLHFYKYSDWNLWLKRFHLKRSFSEGKPSKEKFERFLININSIGDRFDDEEIIDQVFKNDVDGEGVSYQLNSYLNWFDKALVNEFERDEVDASDKKILDILNYSQSNNEEKVIDSAANSSEDNKGPEVYFEDTKMDWKLMHSLEHMLVAEFSVLFGIQRYVLKTAVKIWSDKIVLKFLKL